jgi:hypothetical protein
MNIQLFYCQEYFTAYLTLRTVHGSGEPDLEIKTVFCTAEKRIRFCAIILLDSHLIFAVTNTFKLLYNLQCNAKFTLLIASRI